MVEPVIGDYLRSRVFIVLVERAVEANEPQRAHLDSRGPWEGGGKEDHHYHHNKGIGAEADPHSDLQVKYEHKPSADNHGGGGQSSQLDGTSSVIYKYKYKDNAAHAVAAASGINILIL